LRPMKIGQIVGENIRGFRHAKGWSQEKLGTRSKLHYNYIGCVERGEKSISVDNLSLIAKALKVPIQMFFLEGSYRD
jgi:transcriptional regulator with XRE-family HTH domain